LRKFLDAYAARDAGAGHELVLAYNGFTTREEHAAFDAVAVDTPHTKFIVPETVLDLNAYRQAVDQLTSRYFVFVNTYARPLVDGWLETLLVQARRRDVGMTAASGSWESMSSRSPLITRPLRLAQFKPFPNPHLRTSAFAFRVDVLDQINWFPVSKKVQAWKLENGRHGLSAQVLDLGLELIVAGRDGVGYEWRDWPKSNTFRSGDQENLLVADNRTDLWAEADAATRAEWADLAWGDAVRQS
jgi:hypothetical protein